MKMCLAALLLITRRLDAVFFVVLMAVVLATIIYCANAARGRGSGR
jgi:hypothetical protein